MTNSNLSYFYELKRRMESLQPIIRKTAIQLIEKLYQTALSEGALQIQQTKPEFEGDYTLVLFPLLKLTGQPIAPLAESMGKGFIGSRPDLFSGYQLVGGFLNLTLCDQFSIDFLERHYEDSAFGQQVNNGKTVLVEYASPNTNKPLHLGHLRNIFLGWSMASLYEAVGYKVVKTCIVNDRGIHICKSMLAWQRLANGATPESTGMKGDHFVGHYYVQFNELYKEEVKQLIASGMQEAAAEKEAPIMKAAQQMLLDWEAGNPEILALWKKMNGWVYAGFEATYQRIGSSFDQIYYESDTYLLGKKTVAEGLKDNVFYQKEDGSVWIDLTSDGLDEKLVQRKDGTSVYITQDIGLAELRYQTYDSDTSIYVIGDEQDYHMKVLQLICKKLQRPYAAGIYHLSYGMVELPTGKMKSREGTVVDADDLLDEMELVAKQKTEALGKVGDFTEEERQQLYKVLSLGALKYFLLRVGPKKKMIFNPEESIDFQGHTGPFIQYTYARIRSILRKEKIVSKTSEVINLQPLEKNLILELERYPQTLMQSCTEHDPSHLANYLYGVAKSFNTFYAQHSVLHADNNEQRQLRLKLCSLTARVIANGMLLLGIEVPERM